MRKIGITLVVGAALLTSAAHAQTSSAEISRASQALRQPDKAGNGSLHGLQGQSAGVRGDWALAASLAVKAYREDPTVANEFNLATAYQNTGRSTLAIPLYQDLTRRGQFTTAKVVYNYRDEASGRKMNHLISEEATRRLNMIAGRPAAIDQ
jgi:hypothetical protein